MPSKYSFCLLAFAFASIASGAPEPLPASEMLSWEKCVELVERTNPELLAATNTVRSLELAERSSYGAFMPAVSGSLGFNRIGDGAVGGARLNYATGYTAGLTASWNLFSGFADRARTNEAKGKREAAQATLAATRARISFELKSAFVGLSYAQKLIRLTDEFVDRRDANVRLIELRYDGGRENKGSLFLARAYVEQARLDRLQAGNALAVSQTQMAKLMGRENGADLSVSGGVPLSDPGPVGDLNDMGRSVPEYREAIAREHIADSAVLLARSGYFPTLSLTGGVGRGGPDFFPSQSERWEIGAAITIPLFNGGRDYYGTRSASEGQKAAVLTKENALRAVVVKLRQAYSGYLEAVRRLAVDRQFVEAVAVRSRIAREKYNNGLMTFEDWDVIENDYINRQKSLLSSERDRTIAEASWEQAQGRGVFK